MLNRQHEEMVVSAVERTKRAVEDDLNEIQTKIDVTVDQVNVANERTTSTSMSCDGLKATLDRLSNSVVAEVSALSQRVDAAPSKEAFEEMKLQMQREMDGQRHVLDGLNQQEARLQQLELSSRGMTILAADLDTENRSSIDFNNQAPSTIDQSFGASRLEHSFQLLRASLLHEDQKPEP